ncbi:Aste57867_10895 [Aphanomyces stellatus]|uniref:DNA helicase n=1 Tax=Aphanomyces stellatus TaxID=120398 RepID=A0A485KRK6_9STRA|nr:hypothetical protein As57867_010855 [Aphanomyces stellatus]VFT87763.1 Aste57867_10895 [Aphanomyces stellatus]
MQTPSKKSESATKVTSLERWLDKSRVLLQQEREAEIAQSQLENDTLPVTANPNVLLHLLAASVSTGLFGRTVVVLKQNQGRAFGSHHFSIGDLVQMSIPTASLTPASADGFPKGIVTKVEEDGISVAFEDLDDPDEYHHQVIRLDRLVNDATYRKLQEGLDELAKYSDGPASHVVNIIFHGAAPVANPLPTIVPANDGMNASQIEAIRFALASKDIALIHGPPGTGKTTTLVELIAQCVRLYRMRVLVCAPSNIAVDNILEKTASSHPKLRLTRIGHPARLLPQVLKHCLDAKIQRAEGTQIIADIRKELAALKPTKATRFAVRQESKLLRKEIRMREQKVVTEIVQHSDVVFATNAGAATKLLRDQVFDVVIIDEAAQALEVSCWIPLLKAKRCVLAGDHQQLPPTVKSQLAPRRGLTLFDRVVDMAHTTDVVRMLSTQYRMHADISDWASKAMYEGKLLSSDAVATRKLQDLPHVASGEDDSLVHATLLIVDTAGCGLDEDESEQMSKSNAGEAGVVVKHVEALLAAGLRPHEVAVITPYNGQVAMLKSLLLPAHPTLEVRSVDGFQGCEKEAVVMSLVRSNAKKQVGFLADDRRMNVAVTRAKRHVALIGDTDTLSAHPFLKTLIEHFEELGEYVSAMEYMDQVEGDSTEMLAELQKAHKPIEKSTPVSQKPTKVAKSTEPSTKAKPMTQPIKPTSKTTPASLVESQKPREENPVVDKRDEPPVVVAAPALGADKEDSGDEDDDPLSVSAFSALNDDQESSSDDEAAKADSNSWLKELHEARSARQPPPPPSSSSKKKKKGKKPTKAEALLVKDRVELPKEMDEMAFLDTQLASANTCAFVQCKQKTHVTGSVCRFCKYKFCYSHGMPEIHGCGAAVRDFEKAKMTQKPSSAPKPNRKALQKALDEKLSKSSQDRKTKTKAK